MAVHTCALCLPLHRTTSVPAPLAFVDSLTTDPVPMVRWRLFLYVTVNLKTIFSVLIFTILPAYLECFCGILEFIGDFSCLSCADGYLKRLYMPQYLPHLWGDRV